MGFFFTTCPFVSSTFGHAGEDGFCIKCLFAACAKKVGIDICYLNKGTELNK